MRYLANKKHQAFIKNSLNIFLYLSFIITIISFFENGFCAQLAEYRGQLYLLLSLVFIYTFYKKFYLSSFVFLLLCIVNFFTISATNNFFANSKNSSNIQILFGSNQVSVSPVLEQIQKHSPDIIAITNSHLENFDMAKIIPSDYTIPTPADDMKNFMITRNNVKQSGRIHLTDNTYAPFASIEENGTITTYIAVDFSGFSHFQINSLLKKISLFITQQDNPVVIFGNFNTVSWSYGLSNFIAENNLSVKNAFFDNIRNLIFPPHYYILGYTEGNFSGNLILKHLNSFSKFTRF